MLLTISTTHKPATDLGYLLHKNPQNIHEADLPFGKATVFYPAASPDFCQAALLLEIDPIDLVRNRKHAAQGSFALQEYINDRPYVASSFFSVALARVYNTALAGKCNTKPDLVNTPLPLEATISTLPCKGGEKILRRLFEPLGYEVEAFAIPLDDTRPEWGSSPYFTVRLKNTCTLKEMLHHLYVLIPVLDSDKHYWTDFAEVDKLVRYSEGWIKTHPDIELITSRYLKGQRYLINAALSQLLEEHADKSVEADDQEEVSLEKKVRLHSSRLEAIINELMHLSLSKVIDLGCGEGKLLKRLLQNKAFREIAGMDISFSSLQRAKQNLNLDTMPEKERERLKLFFGSLIYRDKRVKGYEAAVLSEVIEHLEPFQLDAFCEALFGYAKPRFVIITTPNSEFNVEFKDLPKGRFRHSDHRFEWTRQQFQQWAHDICQRYGYEAHFKGIGPFHEVHGTPSQMAIFARLA